MASPFRAEDLREVHLELTSKCNLACPMCARNVFGGAVSPRLEPAELDLEAVRRILPEARLRALSTLLLCGNYGDPILARSALDVVTHARRVAPGLRIQLHTHGSARDPSWWRALAATKARVTFGVDGLEDTLGVYRRGADFGRVMANAEAFLAAGGRARWRFLAFRHNEHQIEAARERAAAMGFERFDVKHTHRFYKDAFVPRDALGRPDPTRPPRYPIHDRAGRTVGHLEPPRQDELQNEGFEAALARGGRGGFRRLREAGPVRCKVLDPASVYVDAEGYVFPCCWTGNIRAATVDPETHPVLRLVREHGGLEAIRAPDRALDEIVEGPVFAAIAASWAKPTVGEGRLQTCARVCGGGAPLRAANRVG